MKSETTKQLIILAIVGLAVLLGLMAGCSYPTPLPMETKRLP